MTDWTKWTRRETQCFQGPGGIGKTSDNYSFIFFRWFSLLLLLKYLVFSLILPIRRGPGGPPSRPPSRPRRRTSSGDLTDDDEKNERIQRQIDAMREKSQGKV